MPKKPLAFVDVETTGTNAVNGRIIEIGILKVKDDEIVREFQTLINPELRIDPFIEQMTGIGLADLERAPIFSEVKDEIYEILQDSIFVAHNVRFDYSFVRNEFRRFGVNFTCKHFDTVKLARILYPGHTHYNLDAIMERFNIENPARHRAFGDAKVLWEFFRISKNNVQKDIFEEALKLVLKKPSLPASLPKDTIDKLPEKPGVYIFYGPDNSNLYIGKSVNIKDRVLSHFTNDYASASDMKIAQNIKSIETIETAGELSALLLESTLIKKHKPIFNKVLRESRKMLAIVKKTDIKGFNTLEIKEVEQVEAGEIESVLGVYRSIKQLKDSLYELSKDFKLCPKILGLEKVKGSCFYTQIGLCNGACTDAESNLKYNLRFDEAFFTHKVKSWKFKGPILIREGEERPEGHLIDRWCYLGSIKSGLEDIGLIKREYRFDYDTYRILKRYLSNPRNLSNIKQLDDSFLSTSYTGITSF